MATQTFAGGVILRDGKNLTKKRTVQTLFPKTGEMVFPLSQHVGRPAIPVVEPGDYVRTGTLIAKADGALSANLHASVSGIVTAIEPRKVSGGRLVRSIVIDNDGLFLEEPVPEDTSFENLTRRSAFRMIRNAGIVGMGGSGMPTAYKIRQADQSEIDTVIANCVECDPYETSDYRRILEDPWRVISGLMVLLTIFPRARGFIALSEKNREGYRLLRNLLKDNDRIFVRRLSEKYPQGSERQLIYALTGRQYNAAMLPSDIGCLVQNTDTLVAINQAVMMHQPLITRILTVTGDALRHPRNFRVRIGTSFRDILEQEGGLVKGCSLDDVVVLDGGPMMGHPVEDLDVPVTKTTSSIVVCRKEDLMARPETACTRCGRCVEVCPNRLSPLTLYLDLAADKKKGQNADAGFLQHGGMECSGCGCCSYVCPSAINLTAAIYAKKRRILQDPVRAGAYARRYVRAFSGTDPAAGATTPKDKNRK